MADNDMMADENGIEITKPLNLGDMMVGETKSTTIWVRNTGEESRQLLDIMIESGSQLKIHLPKLGKITGLPHVIGVRRACILTCSCTAKYLGENNELIVFKFEDFEIGRVVNFNVADDEPNGRPEIQQPSINIKQEGDDPNGRTEIQQPSINIKQEGDEPNSITKVNQSAITKIKPADDWEEEEGGQTSATTSVTETQTVGYKPIPHKELMQKDNEFRARRRECIIVPGERIEVRRNRTWEYVNIPQYDVPDSVYQAVEEHGRLERVFNILGEKLNGKTYHEKFSYLLFCEEAECRLEMRRYDQQNVILKRVNDRFFELDVPGLAEGRPSLIRGDRIYTAFVEVDDERLFEGFVHQVNRDSVFLRFDIEFHEHYANQAMDITFDYNRITFRRCHHAVGMCGAIGKSVIFPESVESKPNLVDVPFTSINWFNPQLNYRQRLAAYNVLKGSIRPSPYLIYGPPGTGKTVTLVESILQVFHHIKGSRILAATSSNACADLIAFKLIESGQVTTSDMIRLLSHHKVDTISSELQPYAKESREDPDDWLFRRIVVTTCSSAGTAFCLQIRADHFTHLFMDEASQATEPESLIPISLVAVGVGVSVIVGDPFQLGPVCMNSSTKRLGLEESLMNRMFRMAPYMRDSNAFDEYGGYNPQFIAKLLTNYRSEARILTVPNELFYENELDATVPPDAELLKKMGLNFPILFHGIKGKDQQDVDNPSWYNPDEVAQVVDYLKQIYDAGVSCSEVGIVTPYRKQVEKITTLIRHKYLKECKVATVEEFQGDERSVIIVSMVRTSSQQLESDKKFNLGFLFNEKRFNVAVTRAKNLVILIGDPGLLSRDDIWHKYIDYCKANKACVGCSMD